MQEVSNHTDETQENIQKDVQDGIQNIEQSANIENNKHLNILKYTWIVLVVLTGIAVVLVLVQAGIFTVARPLNILATVNYSGNLRENSATNNELKGLIHCNESYTIFLDGRIVHTSTDGGICCVTNIDIKQLENLKKSICKIGLKPQDLQYNKSEYKFIESKSALNIKITLYNSRFKQGIIKNYQPAKTDSTLDIYNTTYKQVMDIVESVYHEPTWGIGVMD